MTTLCIFLLLFIFCSAVYAVGVTIHQRIKLQNACDAAAYSAAVVQADGLSRMAVVNKAMSWTYVQMTNRQMDYVTYRWLMLANKRFDEDFGAAKKYRSQLILAIDKGIGWYAILEALLTGAINFFIDADCATGGHRKDGGRLAYWCSTGAPVLTGKDDDMRLNDEIITFPKSKIKKYGLDPFGMVFGGNDSKDASEWASRLGKLIDNDKANINNMNIVLGIINQEMYESMKSTAENVLKASLRDPRIDTSNAMKNYYISIKIPQGLNPYSDEAINDPTAASKSFFSPLHNTEPEERLFLQMQSKDHAGGSLASMFPTLLGSTNQACGIDQWFIRGKGTYEGGDSSDDDKDANFEMSMMKSADKSYSNGKSGQLDGGGRLTGTVRDEGSLGIQRVYKDANLNEGKAGGFGSTVGRGNHILDPADALLALVEGGIDFFTRSGAGKGKSGFEHGIGSSNKNEVSSIEEAEKRVNKQNSKLQEKAEENWDIAHNDMFSQEERMAASKRAQEYERQIAENKKQLGQMKNMQANAVDGSGSGESATISESDMSNAGNVFENLFKGLFADLLTKLSAEILDVEPSCDNVHPDKLFSPPMCLEANETTALVADYKWASCKWYCITKLSTWVLSLVFTYPEIWCDVRAKEFFSIGIIKIMGKGQGHYGLPKWFCGSEPHNLTSGFLGDAFDKFLNFLPPLMPNDISGGNHGYMKTPWDFAGFFKPVKELFSSVDVSRDDYCSCVTFLDGSFQPIVGKKCPAGFIRGHGRIYGDDKEIFDNRYVGARCMPWVLNEKFFSEEGTIVIGAAFRHYNPFVQLFNMLQDSEESKISEQSVLSAFDIPDGNYMWTLSAARAGVRRHRRNAEFDGDRMYQIVYDSTSDPENLAYGGSTKCIREKGGEVTDWQSPDDWCNDNDTNGAARSAKGDSTAIWDGCVCKSSNKKAFENMWNLCETDWDATLIPVRYVCQTASLASDDEAFSEMGYDDRRDFIADKDSDDLSKGSNWIWSAASTDLISPVPIVTIGWKSADKPYYELLDFSGIIPGDGPDLNTRFPMEKKSTFGRYLLFIPFNRIL